MSRMVAAIIIAEAGGAWAGHTFFRVINPLSQVEAKYNSILEVEAFCQRHNLFFDRELIGNLISKLEFSLDNGWSVPKSALVQGNLIFSSINYLKEIQKDLF